MTGDESRAANDLFDRAVTLRPSAWDAFLAQECADTEMRARVLSWLNAYSSSFLENQPAPQDDSADLPEGTRVAGRYLTVRRLGAGGMGQVHLARDEVLHKPVALKRLLDSAALPGASRDRQRLAREAILAAQIAHPNVASTLDLVEHDGRWFIVMEYVEGESLAEVLQRGPLPADRVIAIGRELASALQAAHAKGIIHRDLKPANVQVTPDGTAKLLDFGIAAVSHRFTTLSVDAGPPAIVGGVLAGTPGYMSPEQMRRQAVDERSDVFSLGLVLFEMATGERAYPSRDWTLLEAAVMRPLRPAGRRVPRGLSEIIARAVEVDPANRFASAGELNRALEALERKRLLRVAFAEALASQFGVLRSVVAVPAPTMSWTARNLFRAVRIGVPAAVLFAFFGFLSSTTFNTTLGRREFAQETLWGNFVWGLRSCVAPAVAIAFALLTVTVIVVIRNLVVALSARAGRLDDTVHDTLTLVSRRLRLSDPPMLASWLLLVSAAALVASWWSFWPLLHAVFLQVAIAKPGDLVPLSPSNESTRVLYRQAFNAITVLSVVAWYQVARMQARTGRPLPWSTKAGGIVTVLLALISLQVPYRLFFQNKFPAVTWHGSKCYDIGRNTASVLLFCPATSGYLHQVPLTEPLEPLTNRTPGTDMPEQIVESIFTEFGPH